jgi:hypothetical protein
MIDIQQVIDHILASPTTATYTVQHVRIKEPILADLTDLAASPKIYVGYYAVDAKNPTVPIEHDLFNQHGEDLVQTIEVQIVCEEINFSTIWRNVYKSLIGWHPNVLEQQHTGLTYAQGGTMGIENGRMWWLDRWKVGFPTVMVDV